MVNSSDTILLLDDSTLVLHESFGSGCQSDGEWLSFGLFEHLVNTCEITPSHGITNRLFRFVCTLRLSFTRSRGIWVILIGHKAIILLVLPSSCHPATSTASVSVLATIPVFDTTECAINELLLGQTHRFLILLDSKGAL